MSRPHENLELRNEYRLANPWCELTEHLQGPEWESVRRAFGWSWNKGLQLHHIYRLGRGDYWSNLITTCNAAHKFCHPDLSTESPAGKIACYFVKWEKGELDLDEIREWTGQCPLAWLERNLQEVSEHYHDLGRRILDGQRNQR